MPEVPTPGVKGQVLSAAGLQPSMSISSLEPAARMLGWLASTARAGSFCLFCEKGVGGLPKETSVSGLKARAGATPTRVRSRTNANAKADRRLSCIPVTPDVNSDLTYTMYEWLLAEPRAIG